MQLRTKDHPEACGRAPLAGEHGYTLTFPLEDGTNLDVLCGEESLLRFSDMIGRMLIDNAAASIERHVYAQGADPWPRPEYQSQGLCETTSTERFANSRCVCATYPGNLGPCAGFEAGSNGRCVYCDHENGCHASR